MRLNEVQGTQFLDQVDVRWITIGYAFNCHEAGSAGACFGRQARKRYYRFPRRSWREPETQLQSRPVDRTLWPASPAPESEIPPTLTRGGISGPVRGKRGVAGGLGHDSRPHQVKPATHLPPTPCARFCTSTWLHCGQAQVPGWRHGSCRRYSEDPQNRPLEARGATGWGVGT